MLLSFFLIETIYKKPEYAAMDFRIKPEFTQMLNSRRIVENYNGTLSCSLKCNPKPKIRWFKNKTEIIDNPKYKMTQAMGNDTLFVSCLPVFCGYSCL